MASLQQQIAENVKNLSGGAITAEIAESLRRRVLNVCKPGGEGDPLSTDAAVRETGKAWCITVTSHLLKHRWLLPAKGLLCQLWDTYAERQRTSNKRVYRALLSQLLTEVTYTAGQRGEALRWSLLTQADDTLGGHAAGGGHGKHWLYGVFGLSEVERSLINSVAKRCRKEAEKTGWKQPAGFAEEVIRRLIQDDAAGRPILQHYLAEEEFHLTPAFMRVLLDRIGSAQTPNQKGRRLEDAAFHLFSVMAGCIPRRNLLDLAGASEYDLVVNNLAATWSLGEALFGRHFLVECKNWEKPVGVQEVGYFLFRMGLTHCRFGVILARNGITPKGKREEHARSLVRRAYHEHGSACIVLDMSDLEQLASGKATTITGLMIDRLNGFRFGM